jgi:hypothetical protein
MVEPSDVVITLGSPFAAATVVVRASSDPIERRRVRAAKPGAKWELLVRSIGNRLQFIRPMSGPASAVHRYMRVAKIRRRASLDAETCDRSHC